MPIFSIVGKRHEPLHPLDRGCWPSMQRCSGDATRSAGGLADRPPQPGPGRVALPCFGPALRGWTSCRQCGEKLEFELDGRPWRRASSETSRRSLSMAEPSGCQPAEIWRKSPRSMTRSRRRALLEALPGRRSRPRPDQAAPATDWTEEISTRSARKWRWPIHLAEIMPHFDCPMRDFSRKASIFRRFCGTRSRRGAAASARGAHAGLAYGWSEAEILSLNAARREFISKWYAHERISAAPGRQCHSARPSLHPLVGSIFSGERAGNGCACFDAERRVSFHR